MFVIEGHDGPGAAALRARHLDAHVAHLTALGDGFVIGGPFLDQNNASIGSLIVVELTDRAAAEAFAAADPFVLNKVFERIEIRRWDFGHLRQKGRG